jgi:hypothetical protein
MNRVAKFYGISEDELNRRSGILENNLQAYRDMLRSVIMAKIVEHPEDWSEDALAVGLIIINEAERLKESGALKDPRREEEENSDREADDGNSYPQQH